MWFAPPRGTRTIEGSWTLWWLPKRPPTGGALPSFRHQLCCGHLPILGYSFWPYSMFCCVVVMKLSPLSTMRTPLVTTGFGRKKGCRKLMRFQNLVDRCR